MVGTSEPTIRIELWSKEQREVLRTLSVAQFVNELKTLPSKGIAYRIYFHHYTFPQHDIEAPQPVGESVWVATHRDHLSFELFPSLLAYICYDHRRNHAEPFTLTKERIHHYALTRKDVAVLKPLIETCNNLLQQTTTINKQ